MQGEIALISVPLIQIKQMIIAAVSDALSNQQAAKVTANDCLFDIEEAAKYCKLSKPTMYGLVSKGEIPHAKKGKRLYFLEAELMNWIKEGRKKTNAELAHEAERIVANKKKGGRYA
jgi:excisionase family DNA binding protein